MTLDCNFSKEVVVVTGGSGVIGSTICRKLAELGASVAILARNKDKIESLVHDIRNLGGNAQGYSVDVLDVDRLHEVKMRIEQDLGECTILINGAGGNNPKATTSDEFFSVHQTERDFFQLDGEAVGHLFDLNFLGTLLPTQVFAQGMAKRQKGTILNISSMNAYTPLTKIPAYSGAKAAISNFTQWLAVYFSKSNIRVNAIAPGFFLTEQNHSLLIKEDGELSQRAEKIIGQTPMGRFGEPEELLGAIIWLLNERASSFVTGVVIPIDGGFSAYSGV